MIWIAWRFQRSVVLALALLALVIIGTAVATGVIEHHDFVRYMAAPCHGSQPATPSRGDYCGVLAVKLASITTYNTFIRAAGFIIAPLVGAVLGILAVASEVDSRTARLAWTQSISRTRWFGVKAGVGAASVTMILVPTAVVLSWWNGTIGGYDRFGREIYGIAGWDLVAYGLFMFALTLLLGAVIKRVGWSLAASVLLFLIVAVAVPSKVRLHLVAPTVKWTEPYVAAKGEAQSTYDQSFPRNAWLLVNGAVVRSTKDTPTWGDVIAIMPRLDSCLVVRPTKTQTEYVKAERACYKKLNVANVTVFIPESQFWTLQLREGLLYLSAGLILTGGALVLVRRIEP